MDVSIDVSLWKRVCKSLKDLCMDVNMHVDPTEGMYLTSMDTAHVCLARVVMPPTLFHAYACEKHVTFGVHIPHLCMVLDCIHDAQGHVQMSVQDDKLVLRAHATSFGR